METLKPMLTLVSSLLWFLAVSLSVLWLAPVCKELPRRYFKDLMSELTALDFGREDADRIMRWWVMAIVGTLVVFAIFLKMPPVAIGLAYLVFIAPRFILKWMVETRRILLRDQMVQATVAMANSARAGLSQAQGLELVAQESADPLAKEFKRIVHDYHAGRPMADALTETQARLKLESFDVFCSVVLLCMERGGKVSDALERISQSLMERQRLERKLEADTASGRRMALLLGAFPIVFLAGFTVLDPAMMSYMYTTLAGQLVLLLCGVMVYLSVRWCASILTIDF